MCEHLLDLLASVLKKIVRWSIIDNFDHQFMYVRLCMVILVMKQETNSLGRCFYEHKCPCFFHINYVKIINVYV